MTTNITRATYDLEEFQFMIDSFLNKLGCEERILDSALLSEKLIGLIGYSEVLEKKWNKIKYAAPKTKRDVITEDLANLVLGLELSMKPDEDIFSFGMRVTQHPIDQMALQLPYLDRTGYWIYVFKLGNLLESVSDVYVRHLLNEVKESEDIDIVGQFTKNQVVGYYEWLRKNPMPDKDKEISKLADIYKGLSGIYEKDIYFTYCLVAQKKGYGKQQYKVVRASEFLDKYNFIKRWENSLSEPYSNHVRNSVVHVDYKIDRDRRAITFLDRRSRSEREMTYNGFNRLVQDMSAIVLVYRLLPFLLGNNYWRQSKLLLDRME